MERMCELQYYSVEDEAAGTQGFRVIQLGGNHPYMSNWWPAGHGIGYGETFVNQAYDFISAIRDNKSVAPNFEDGLICQRVLEAAQTSAQLKAWVSL
jgi:predicted dehydrogenase